MIGLTLYDYLLFPLYFFIVYRIFKRLRLKYKDDRKLYLYFTWGFRIKIVIIIVYTLLSHYVIRGDAVDLYYGEGKRFAEIIKDNPSRIDLLFTTGGKTTDSLASEEEKGYLAMESNYMVVKVAIVLCFLSFSCFSIVNLIIGFIAFLASWKLYIFFLEQYPKLHKEFAIACMGIPTVLFWSAGISKDTICMALLAFLTYSMYNLVIKKEKRLFNSLVVLIAVYMIYQIKAYIAVSYLPFFIFFLVLYKIKETKTPILRFLLKFSLPVFLMVLIFFLAYYGEDLMKDFSSEKVLENISSQQKEFTLQAERTEGETAFFSLGEFDGTPTGLMKMAPKAVIATFFRPFIWESHNLIMLLSSLEAIIMLLFTLSLFIRPKGFVLFFSTYFTNRLVFYCITFSLLFALFVGVSSFNFGSLVRYKIPCIPFFVCGLLVIKSRMTSEEKNKDVVPI